MPATDAPPDNLAALKIGVAVIAVILVAFAMWALRHILTPFILAIFLLFMIGGLENALSRFMKVPHRAALPAAIVLVVAFFGLAIFVISHNAAAIFRESGQYADRLNLLLQMGAAKLGVADAPTIDQLFKRVNPAQYIRVAAASVGHVLEGFVFVLIYLGFMLASRKSFENKLNELFQTGESEAVQVFTRIQHGVESYIWVQTVVGLIIAGASALMMWPTGIHHILFWSFLIFLANYIPAIGAAIGVLLPPIFALVDQDSVWKPIALLVGLEAIHFTVSHVVQPRMQGQSLNIDPIVVLLSLAFWGVIFGLAGAFLSTPLTVIVMAVCAEFPATRGVAVLLSDDGKPYARH
jgi:predicted PurR-regulated permease PerM